MNQQQLLEQLEKHMGEGSGVQIFPGDTSASTTKFVNDLVAEGGHSIVVRDIFLQGELSHDLKPDGIVIFCSLPYTKENLNKEKAEVPPDFKARSGAFKNWLKTTALNKDTAIILIGVSPTIAKNTKASQPDNLVISLQKKGTFSKLYVTEFNNNGTGQEIGMNIYDYTRGKHKRVDLQEVLSTGEFREISGSLTIPHHPTKRVLKVPQGMVSGVPQGMAPGISQEVTTNARVSNNDQESGQEEEPEFLNEMPVDQDGTPPSDDEEQDQRALKAILEAMAPDPSQPSVPRKGSFCEMCDLDSFVIANTAAAAAVAAAEQSNDEKGNLDSFVIANRAAAAAAAAAVAEQLNDEIYDLHLFRTPTVAAADERMVSEDEGKTPRPGRGPSL